MFAVKMAWISYLMCFCMFELRSSTRSNSSVHNHTAELSGFFFDQISGIIDSKMVTLNE